MGGCIIKRVACHTLGCKVNQYDTEAMLERFEASGYVSVGFEDEADVYLINTCTVTGTGDQKSYKLVRRVHRERPDAAIVVAGCLAQREAARLRLPGVRLIIGVKRRAEVVTLLERAVAEDRLIDATVDAGDWTFEPLTVTRHEGKTRATMKIQEGCDRYCAYCIIPTVRGPVRSMPMADVCAEAARLAAAGYREIVVTGIHLASYGKHESGSLIEAIDAVCDAAPNARIRLGSLEPIIATDEFVAVLASKPQICPHFHLSLQSGSAGVLSRMRRRYTPDQYLEAARRLQSAWPHCAVTTDVLTGFPGETDTEALETERFLDEVGFARIHVFPYSRRSGTLADTLPDQVPEAVKHERAARLIAIGNRLSQTFVQGLVGSVQPVLLETRETGGLCAGYTPQYARAILPGEPGELAVARLTRAVDTTLYADSILGGV